MNDPSQMEPQKSSYTLGNDTQNIVENKDLPESNTERVLPRQVSSGLSRGNQTLLGTAIVADPSTNRPVIQTSGITQQQIFSDPVTELNRIIIGKLGPKSYGMKVSKDGVDVTKADDNELVFNSNQDIFKIVKKDSVTITIGSSTLNWATVRHDLGFTPIVTAFLNNVGISSIFEVGTIPLPTSLSTSIDVGAGTVITRASIFTAADDTNLYIICFNATGGSLGSFQVTYYYQQETADS